jgi:hypothetical protein|tara:strand:+ start:40 stop:213 length:174 start_codon:yes stop_codon:yes gene_type:complete
MEKKIMEEDRGNLVCVICTNGSPQSEPLEDDNKFIAMCSGCKDWGEFMYEKDMEEEE